MEALVQAKANQEWSSPKPRRGHRERYRNLEHEDRSCDDYKPTIKTIIKTDQFDEPVSVKHEPMDTEHPQQSRDTKSDVQNLIGKPVVLKPRLSQTNITTSNKPRGGILHVDFSKITTVQDQPKPHLQFDLAKEAWPTCSIQLKTDTDDVTLSATSWSTVLKSAPKQKPPKKLHHNSSMETEEEREKEVEIKKSKKKKKKKRNEEMTLELGQHVFEVLQSKQQSLKTDVHLATPPSKRITAVGMLVPPVKNKLGAVVGGAAPRNVLDSSAPSVMRGKEREKPKKKRPSSLRKIIDKDKEERKKLREQGQSIPILLDMHPSGTIPDKSIASNFTPTGLHNRHFREYCSHLVTEKINFIAEGLLTDLVRFQDRIYKNEPTKYKTKRRYVCGLREVKKHLGLKKLRCIIVPPNLQRSQSSGGIDDVVKEILDLAHQQDVPVVFALNRRQLARILKKKFNIGCVGLFNYDGAESKYKQLMEQVRVATDLYKRKRQQLLTNIVTEEPLKEQSDHIIAIPDQSDQFDQVQDLSLESTESEEEMEEESEDCVRPSQWKKLFESPNEPHLPPLSNNSTHSDTIPVVGYIPPSKGFSWNVEAPEFYPQNINVK